MRLGRPSELATLRNRAMAQDPAARPQTVAELRHALEDFVKHQSSVALSAEAERLLSELKRETESLSVDSVATEVAKLRAKGTECRFGFRQALKAWAGNRHAREGLRGCLELLANLELSQGHTSAAEALLSEMETPPQALLEELLLLKKKDQEADDAKRQLDQLRSLRHERDDFKVKATSPASPIATLSGGNVQRAVLAREGVEAAVAGGGVDGAVGGDFANEAVAGIAHVQVSGGVDGDASRRTSSHIRTDRRARRA